MVSLVVGENTYFYDSGSLHFSESFPFPYVPLLCGRKRKTGRDQESRDLADTCKVQSSVRLQLSFFPWRHASVEYH